MLYAKLYGGPADGLALPLPHCNMQLVVRQGVRWDLYQTEPRDGIQQIVGLVSVGQDYGSTEAKGEAVEYFFRRALTRQEITKLRQQIKNSRQQPGDGTGVD